MNSDNIREDIIKSLTLWIEKNLESDLSLDIVAQRSGYSKWHLQRLFKTHTGMVLGKYIRSRRLSCAARALRITNSSILDISLKFRFDSQQTFWRAFKSQFKITPSDYRKKIGWDTAGFCFPLRPDSDIHIQSDLVVLPDLKLIGSDHYYQKNTADARTEITQFRRRFWHQFFSCIDEIPGDLYAMNAPSTSSVDDISYIYTTAIDESLLSGQALRNSSLSGLTLKGGRYLRIKISPEMLAEKTNGYDDIVHSVYERIFPEFNLLRRKGADIEHYKLTAPYTYNDLMTNGLPCLKEINYFIPVIS
ncbi:helix-turn-helix domain-containing protein [Morganella psychrotolerans]|uniref:Right origin-binding protein n=1 Tax=Morganella psychrotolerans TaxID=368603 RepID=A0A1B8HUQ1_9GAMM|nr:helix-turn-helix domain-containing protein [Morganella psychrotolerans]OBU13603.1 right origin-binding protein [Morganella psychrotolerans]